MNTNDIQKIFGTTLAIAGVFAAGKAFASRAESVEQKGLGLVSGVLLLAAGAVLIARVDDAADNVRNLLS